MDLLHDRYVVCGERAFDLVSGDECGVGEIPLEAETTDERDIASLVELFDHGRNGEPRWIVADAGHGSRTASMVRRVISAGRRRGFVPMSLDSYQRFGGALADQLRERPLLLLGGRRASSGAREALIGAAALSARPHVLLTFQASPARVPVVREARSAYGARTWEPAEGTWGPAEGTWGPTEGTWGPTSVGPAAGPLPGDVQRLLARADGAVELAVRGRHAAAGRVLREVAAALERRSACAQAASVACRLVDLRLERGDVEGAARASGDAVRLANQVGVHGLLLEARCWQALVSVERGRLTEAESLLRAMLLAGGVGPLRVRTEALLARCLLLQGRPDAAAAIVPSVTALGKAATRGEAEVFDVAVAIALAVGEVFKAGGLARVALDRSASTASPFVRVIAMTAYLRVLCAAGDLTLAETQWRMVRATARACHAPIRAAWARLILVEALQRGDQAGAATSHLRALRRLRGRATPLLQRALGAGATPAFTKPLHRAPTPERLAAELVRLMYEEPDDRLALQQMLERLNTELVATRADLVSADGGPPTVVVSAGGGPLTTLGRRTMEAGVPIGFDDANREAAMPIRHGSHLLGAVIVRWPVDRVRPVEAEPLMALTSALVAPRLEAMQMRNREVAAAATEVPELIGASDGMLELRRSIVRAARAPFAVLIEGESGTGKELVARAIHQLGPRRERRFGDINCAALPDDLLESELFGHARGAFTGAVVDRPGLFEEATGGTLFLDELGELSARAQAKLLRVVQQQEVRRVGETISRVVDVRLVAATNRDLAAEAESGRFRRDLLYRLNVIHIRVPPLRERVEDIPALATHFWTRAAQQVKSTATLSPQVLADLARYHWPGNVRELQNVIAALAVAAPSCGRIGRALLPAVVGGCSVAPTRTLAEARDQFERRYIEVALARAGDNRTRAASALGLTRQGLAKTMARLGVRESAARSAE